MRLPSLLVSVLLAACSARSSGAPVPPVGVDAQGALDATALDAQGAPDIQGVPLCTPGTQIACACPGGVQSVQVCGPTGTYGACSCPDAGGMDAPAADDASGAPDTGPSADRGADAGPGVLDAPFSCTANADCAGNPAGPACHRPTGRCVGCVADDDCPADRFCNLTTRTCAPGCRGDASCAGDAGAGRRCDLGSRACVQCTLDEHCTSGTLCVGNVCVTGCTATRGCPGGRSCCSGACVDTQSNTTACGACDSRCSVPNGSAICVNGMCAVGSCSGPFRDCNANGSDGCEANTSTDVQHCGTCGRACAARAHATTRCASGACDFTCDAGFTDCDMDPSNGCEVDLRTSLAHCGGCGTRCAPPNGTGVCSAGRCALAACAEGYADCDGGGDNGCETNTGTSTVHCGRCGVTCDPGLRCTAGRCVLACPTGFADCDGAVANGCEASIRNNPRHCGACGRACATGQLCNGDTCIAI